MNSMACSHPNPTAHAFGLAGARFVDVARVAVTGPIALSAAGAGVRRSPEEGPPRDRWP